MQRPSLSGKSFFPTDIPAVPTSPQRSSTSSFSASPPIPGLEELSLNSDDAESTTNSPSRDVGTVDPSHPDFEYGEAVFLRRRAEWLALPAPEGSRSKERVAGRLGVLEGVLGELQNDEIPDEVWKGGLEGVWRGLVGGRRLANPMPLATVIKVLKAGWVKDGTWPAGYVAAPSSSPPLTPPLAATALPVTVDQPSAVLLERPHISPHPLNEQATGTAVSASASTSSNSVSTVSTVVTNPTPTGSTTEDTTPSTVKVELSDPVPQT